MTWRTAIALTLAAATAPSALAGAQKPSSVTAAPAGVEVVIRDPGHTGLTPGRYRVTAAPSGGSIGIIILVLTPPGGGTPMRLTARLRGCGAEAAAKARRLIGCEGSAHLQPADGSLRLEFAERSESHCKLVAVVPAAHGTGGSPEKIPGIEGTDVSTGAPAPQPPLTAKGADEADRQLADAIAQARKALPKLSCTDEETRGGKRLAQTRAQLAALASAATPAAAVAPLRRFERAVELLAGTLAEDSALRDATLRCTAARDRCAGTGTPAASCAIEEAICLAGVACPQH